MTYKTHALRVIVDAILYVARSGCAGRLLPRVFPRRKTVFHYFRRWRLDGTWLRLHTALREATRERAGRNVQPHAAIIDSQSVKTTSVGDRGYDGAKKVTGRKRHILVDTQGLLHVRVHPSDRQDRTAIPLLLEGIAQQFPQIEHVWVDQGYMGSGRAWIEEHLGWRAEVVKHASPPRGHWIPHSTTGDLSDLSTVYFTYERFKSQRTGFRRVLPRRWVVVRSFGWMEAEPPVEQGLRALHADRRDLDLHRHESAHASSPDYLMWRFRRFPRYTMGRCAPGRSRNGSGRIQPWEDATNAREGPDLRQPRPCRSAIHRCPSTAPRGARR